MPPRLSASSAPSFRDFLHRTRVLQQYRSFLRELRGLDERLVRDLRGQVREGFRKGAATATTGAAKQAALTEGTRQLQMLRTYAGGARKHAENAASMGIRGSWVGTGTPDDVRGRVGVAWPWDGGSDAEEPAQGGPGGNEQTAASVVRDGNAAAQCGTRR
jgi:hypothetical protein